MSDQTFSKSFLALLKQTFLLIIFFTAFKTSDDLYAQNSENITQLSTKHWLVEKEGHHELFAKPIFRRDDPRKLYPKNAQKKVSIVPYSFERPYTILKVSGDASGYILLDTTFSTNYFGPFDRYEILSETKLVITERDGKKGLRGYAKIFEPTYDDIMVKKDLGTGHIAISLEKGGQKDQVIGRYSGIAKDLNNKIVLLDDINWDSENEVIRTYKDGKTGVYDPNSVAGKNNHRGNYVLPAEYDDHVVYKVPRSYRTGHYAKIVTINDGKYGYYDLNKDINITPKYESLEYLRSGILSEFLRFKENAKFGILSTVEAILIPPEFDEIRIYPEGQERIDKKGMGKLNILAVRIGDKWAPYSIKDKKLLDKFKYVEYTELSYRGVKFKDEKGNVFLFWDHSGKKDKQDQ